MPDLKRITLPSGSTYDLVDQGARDLIASLEKKTFWLGITTTFLNDGSSVNPIIVNGESVTAKAGDMVGYGNAEFIFNGTIWQEFGDLSFLGSLAFKDSASGSYTPAGTVTAPTITMTKAFDTINGITDVGSLPTLGMTVQNETLTITFDAGSLPTKGEDVDVLVDVDPAATAPTFVGSAGTISVS